MTDARTRRRLSTAALFLLATLTPALASAQDAPADPALAALDRPDFRFDVGVVGGAHIFYRPHTLGRSDIDPEDQSPQHAPVFGISAAIFPIRALSVEVDALALYTHLLDDSTNLWIFQLGANLRIHPWMLGPVQPYLSLGYGAIASVVEDDFVQPDDQDGVGRLGLGARFALSERLGVRVEARLQSSLAFANDVLAVGDETGYGGPDFLALASFYVNLWKTPKVVVREKVFIEETPPDPDPDRDGIPNRADRCPNDPEDPDGYQDEDGCPDKDNDGDGIPDADDRCPLRAETVNGIDDEDGCPETDEDGDGILGSKDQCPEQPETKNGWKDDDGCPDELPEDVKPFVGRIEGVNFKSGSANLLRNSFPILDRAVEILQKYPELRIEIEGHTDSRGKADYNRDLSQRRAEAVRAYLISKGVSSDRLVAVGYGLDRPIATNKTKAGRSKNRRTEFRILTEE